MSEVTQGTTGNLEDSNEFAEAFEAAVKEHGGESMEQLLNPVSDEDDPDVGEAPEQQGDVVGIDGDESTVDTGEFASDDDAAEPDDADDEPAARGRPGFDQVIQRLREERPEDAEVAMEPRREMDRMRNRFNDLQEQMIDVTQRLLTREQEGAAPAAATEEAETDESPYSETQLDNARNLLRAVGVTFEEDRQAEAENAQVEDYVEAAMESGLDQFGESFGYRDDAGEIQLTEEARTAIAPILERIDRDGVNPLDMYRLAGLGTAASNGDGATEAPGEAKPRRTREQARKSRTVQRSTGGNRAPAKLAYKPGDDPEDVFNQSFALAAAQLRG